jgi:hypothetical protein
MRGDRRDLHQTGDSARSQLRDRLYKMNIVATLGSAVSESKLVGDVAENYVVVHRVRPFAWSIFKPYFYGRFVKHGDKVVLEGIFSVAFFAKMTFFALLALLALFELVHFFGQRTTIGAESTIPSFLYPIGMAAALLSFLFISKQIFSSDVEWISVEIEKALAT